ncbi:MAG: glycosyltransferase family 8 protein [Clostridia bacterium]|nr:glycosyltransferase family 8 protein [Clostridia bacterium]
MKNLVPIFFATDDNYMPYLDVAISSLVSHTSEENFYEITILNTGLRFDYKQKIKKHEKENVSINFFDMTFYIDGIKSKLKEVLHFSLATYYRLFIQSLFPQYKKVLYLDCDIVVLDDVALLYETDLKDNMLAGAIEQFVYNTQEYSDYAKYALGLDVSKYVNAGILVMDLEKFRENKIEQKFIHMILNYNFDLVDCDQAYLNFLCRDKILILDRGWNKTNYPIPYEGKVRIAHFALAEKPWQSDVLNGELFWDYAKKSEFYEVIKQNRENFSEEDREKKRQGELNLRKKAVEITNSDCTFYRKIILGILNNADKEAYGEI